MTISQNSDPNQLAFSVLDKKNLEQKLKSSKPVCKPKLESSFKFTKAQRLLTPADYKQVFDAVSFKVHTDHLIFLVKVSGATDATSINNRLGLAISKAKMKRAHERNRIKRLLREHFRLKQAYISQKTQKHFDMVVLAKKSMENRTNKALNTELDAAFHKLRRKLTKYIQQ